ncbi:MAG: hypothetical protein ACI9MC_000600 [Kiritimatiellia bacterium]
MFLQDHTDDALPPRSQLDAAVQMMVAERDDRHLIVFVETWAKQDNPSNSARLAQAQAFSRLRQMDKAWIRIKDMVEATDASREVLQTAAEIFVRRGWPAQARKFLNRALVNHPDDRELQRLWDLASKPPIEPDHAARALEEENNVDRLLPVAEDYLSTGQVIHARSVLEKLKRHHPNHPRINDLLWVMEGDYSNESHSLQDLCRRYVSMPRLPKVGDMESEHTETLKSTNARRLAHELDHSPVLPMRTSFPSLFRDDDADITDEVTEEITVAMAMATREQMIKQLDKPADANADTVSDTRIRRVFMTNGAAPSEAPIHRGTPSTEPGFDLVEFRREMGMSTVDIRATIPSNFGHNLEDEDDELVVITRRERALRPIEPPLMDDDPTKSQLGREVAHLLKKPPGRPLPPIADINIPVPDMATPPPVSSIAPPDPTDEVTLEPLPAPEFEWVEPRRGPNVLTMVWIGVLAVVLFGGTAMLLLLLLLLTLWPG